jgi:hypothetical protein
MKNIYKSKPWNITLYIPSMPKVVFIYGVLMSFYGGKSLCVFYSMRVFYSIEVSPSPLSSLKNLDTCACVMYTLLIDTLFVPPWLTLGIHTKSMFEKGGFVGFWT